MKAKHIFTLLLAVCLLLSVFAGCSSKESATDAANTVAAGGTGNETTSGTGADQAEPVADPGEVSLPLTDTPVTYSIFCTFGTEATTISTYAESMYYQEMAKRTNVSFDFHHPASGGENEEFQLMMASFDYDDVVRGFSLWYTSGMDHAIESEIARPLNDYTQYLPTLMNKVNADDDIKREMLTDSGWYWMIPSLYEVPQSQWGGPIVRQDLLDQFGLAAPQTYADWETMLSTFRDNVPGMENGPLTMPPTGFSIVGSFVQGYNLSNSQTGWLNKDGVAVFSPLEPSYKEYIGMLADWYSRSLLDRDFHTKNNIIVSFADIGNGTVAAAEGPYEIGAYNNVLPADGSWVLSPVPTPLKSVSEPSHVRLNSGWISTGSSEVITTAVTDEELPTLLRYYDYMFTPEGDLLANWGVEGVTFEYDANGKPQYTDLMLNNPDGLSFIGANAVYLGGRNMAGPYGWRRELTDDLAIHCMEVWDGNNQSDWVYPAGATPTEAEGREYAQIMGDIQTLISENVLSFITGAKPMNEYDAFIDQLKGMNVDRLIAIQQAALDRYLHRAG